MDTNDLFYLIFLKYNILNNDYRQILNIALEEDNVENLLDCILLLLEREPNFVYFDKKIFDYLYNLNNEVRFEYRKEEIFEKTAQIIRKLNRLKSEDSLQKRRDYMMDEWYLRMGELEEFDEEEIYDIRSEDIKKLYIHDFKFMCELASPDGIYMSDDIFNYLSSISYFANRYHDIFDDEVIENLLLILSAIEMAINEFHKQKQIDSYEYATSKTVIESIRTSFRDYYKRHKEKKKEHKKLVYTIEN